MSNVVSTSCALLLLLVACTERDAAAHRSARVRAGNVPSTRSDESVDAQMSTSDVPDAGTKDAGSRERVADASSAEDDGGSPVHAVAGGGASSSRAMQLGDVGAAGGAGAAAPSGPTAGSAGAPIPAEEPPAVTAEPRDAAAYLFDQQALRSYNLVVAPTDLAAIDAQPSAEAWVPASLEFEGKTYGPYKIRYKGAAGSFMYPCTQGLADAPKEGKCSIKLGANEVDPGARFFGLKKLNFHALNADRSLLRDRLGYALFREMGVAAPRAVHARLFINGQLEGLFALVEQVDGRFTRARFGDGGEGNLYKEIWPLYTDAEVYLRSLETNEDEMPSVQRMLDFATAVRDGATATQSFVDTTYLTRMLAVDRVIINDDGIFHFWCDPTATGNNPGNYGNHNYYWYQDLTSARFWLIPWDLDNSFNNTPFVHIEPEWTVPAECVCAADERYGVQRASSCDPLIQHFASWHAAFEKEIDAFLAGPFQASRVEAKLDAWSAQIRGAVAEAQGLKHAPSEAEWMSALMQLSTVISSARQHRGYAY